MTLKPLSGYEPGPYRPRRLAVGALLAVAPMYLLSVPLHWVGVVTATGSYRIASGFERATWIPQTERPAVLSTTGVEERNP